MAIFAVDESSQSVLHLGRHVLISAAGSVVCFSIADCEACLFGVRGITRIDSQVMSFNLSCESRILSVLLGFAFSYLGTRL